MGADLSRAVVQGVGILDPRVEITPWDDHSTFNQAGPRPGVPEPRQDTKLTLESSGEQSADRELRIRTLRAGFARPSGGAFVWRNKGDSLFRGYDVPNVIKGWRALLFTTGASDPFITDQMDAITLSTGEVLCAYRRQTQTGPINMGVNIQIRDASTSAWSDVSVASFGNRDLSPTMVELPNGDVALFHWIFDSNAEEHQVRKHISSDKGQTWIQAQSFCLKTGIDGSSSPGAGNPGFEVGRLRARFHTVSGQIILVCGVNAHDTTGVNHRQIFVQQGSDDLGASFSQITDIPTAQAEAQTNGFGCGFESFEVVAIGDVFHLYYIALSVRSPHRRRVGNAFEDLLNDAPVNIDQAGDNWATAALAEQDLMAFRDEDGSIYVAGRLVDLSQECTIIRSADQGETFTPMGTSSVANNGLWYNMQNPANGFPRHFTATVHQGAAFVFHNWTSQGGTHDDSLGVLTLGGYGTVTMAGHQAFPTEIQRVSWEQTYLPFDLPGATTLWARTDTGGTEALSSGRLSLVTTANTNFYTKTRAGGTTEEGITVYAQLQIPSGGSESADEIALRVELSDAANSGWDVSVRFTTSTLRVFDNVAAAQVGADVTGLSNITSVLYVKIAMVNDTFRMWFRNGVRLELETDREWIEGPTGAITEDLAFALGSNRIRFGHLVAGTAASHWYELHDVDDSFNGLGLADGQENPEELFPRTYSGESIGVDDLVRITAIDGPTIEGDSFFIDTRYDFAIENVHPEFLPSPRKTWRSTDETQQQIAWQVGESGGAHGLNDIYVFVLENLNWRTGEIQRRAGGTWNTVITLDTATDRTGLPFDRVDNTVRPSATANTPLQYFAHGELVGSHVDLGSGRVAKILHNTEGFWGDAVQKRPTLLIDSPLTGLPSSGTLDIWSNKMVAILQLTDGRIEGWRLQIDAQTGPDGFFEVGTFFPGYVMVFGHQYSRGRIRQATPNSDMREALDGSRRSRNLGLTRFAAEIAWSEGVDLSKVQGDLDDDFLLQTVSANARPVAARNDMPLLAESLVDVLQGDHKLCVYLPTIPKGTPDVVQFNSRDRWLYSRLRSIASIEGVLGQESANEVYRIAKMRFEQEV